LPPPFALSSVFIRDSLEFVRQFGACIATGIVGLAEEVGKIVICLGPDVRPRICTSRGTVHQSHEPASHELHAVRTIGLVFWQTGYLLPEPDAHTPEGEDDQGDRAEDANPRENAIAAR
jgi:hypothetical protein